MLSLPNLLAELANRLTGIIHLQLAILSTTTIANGSSLIYLLIILFYTPNMRKYYLTSLLLVALSTQAQAQTTTSISEQLAEEEKSINISDSTFREYRLAVLLTYEEIHSEKFGGDKEKIKTWLKELETYLNSIYVRDAGVKFTIVYDDRLLAEDLHSRNVFIDNANTATNEITKRIGNDGYDIGVVCRYDMYDNAGLATIGAIKWDDMKGNVTSMKQDNHTIAHELSHAFGCQHTWVTGSEPGNSGQSIAGYGFSSITHFLSLASLSQLTPTVQLADRLRNASYKRMVSETNTAPRIDRERMKREYIVPKNTFFTIPVYASDAEQDSLYYSYAQWDYLAYKPAHFPTFPATHNNVLNFGRTYSTANWTLVPNSDTLPVGEYKMLISVSDALPTEEAIAKEQAPLRDNFLTIVKVVEATPFKINPTLKTEFMAGERFMLKWDVDKDFFSPESKVRVLLSDDGGTTFKHILVPETANDGECEVVLPQQEIDRMPTYTIHIPSTGEDRVIYTQGKAVLRLEVIGQGYFDITDNNMINGGSSVSLNPIKFEGLPISNYIELGADEEIPAIPDITASSNGWDVPVTYSESIEGDLTRRLWVANDGNTENAYVQYIKGGKHTSTGIHHTATNETILPNSKSSSTANCYDLSGRRVIQPTKKGVYIRNGQKVIF